MRQKNTRRKILSCFLALVIGTTVISTTTFAKQNEKVKEDYSTNETVATESKDIETKVEKVLKDNKQNIKTFTEIERNNKSISIPVTITDGNVKNEVICTEGQTVREILENNNIAIGPYDQVNADMNEKINSIGKTIEIRHTICKNVKRTSIIKYKIEYKKSNKFYQSQTKTLVKGKDGKKTEIIKEYIINEKIIYSNIVSSKMSKPINAVILTGTKKDSITPNGIKSTGSRHLGEVISGRYTHYCACAECGTGDGMTASGRRVYNGMTDPHYIACNWLPMGSVVSVDGTNYTVVDTGGNGLSAIGRIDIFTPEGHAACYKYGTGPCTLRIVRLGW